MKSQFKKAAAMALAMTMCVPGAALAADGDLNTAASGSFNTSFDVYSPALHISVPLKADIQVNPMADSTSTGVKQFTVASNSIDVINASVDTEADVAIPVNVTVKAAITKAGEDVVTEYNTFTEDPKSTKKKIHLSLTQAATAAVLDEANRAAGTGDASKLLDLTTVPVKTAAEYTGATNETAITKYGSLLSVDIAVPTLETGATSFTADPTKVKPTVGSFAVTGVANTNADWKADDVAVAITYNVKASKALAVETPAVAGVNAAANTDVSIVIPNVGESTVVAVAAHNDGEGLYKDYIWEESTYEVTYAANTTTSTQTDATIKISKDDEGIKFLTGDDYKGKPQDLIIQLSDGRYVVSTLTVN